MWKTIVWSGYLNIIPTKDLLGHDLGEKCPCNPEYIYVDFCYLVHNSFDRREYFEATPKRKGVIN